MRMASGGVIASSPGNSTLSSSESLTSGGVEGADDGRTSMVGVIARWKGIVGVTGPDLSTNSAEGARTVTSDICLRCVERPLASSCFGRLVSAHGFERSNSASMNSGDGLEYGAFSTE